MLALHRQNKVTKTQLECEWYKLMENERELKFQFKKRRQQVLEQLSCREPSPFARVRLRERLKQLEQQERHLKNVRRQLEHRQREHEKCVRELEHLQALEKLGRNPCHCCHSPHCRNRDNNHREREKREQRERRECEQRESKYGNTFCAACGIPFFSATYLYKSLDKTCETPTPRKCPECREHCRATMGRARTYLVAHEYGNTFCKSCGVPYFSGSREKTTACVNCR